MLSLVMRYMIVLWMVLVTGITGMIVIGKQLPDDGNISLWFRDNHDARQVRWDLRSNITASGEVTPYKGVLSPDGTMVASARFQSGETVLYRSDPDSLERTLVGVYEYEAMVSPLMWTADSQSVLLVDTFDSLVTRVVRIDMYTGVATLINEQDYITRVAEWSPDGEHVLLRNFLARILAVEVRIVNATTGAVIYFPLLLEARWSPNGQYLAYQTRDEPHIIYLYDVANATTTSKVLALTGGAASLNMVWSPDSEWIAFSYTDGIYQYEVSTGNLTQIVNQVAQLRGWSPDGQTLALYILERNKQQLYLLRYDTRELIAVTGLTVRISAGMVWSDDGQMLILSDNDRRLVRVQVIDVPSAVVSHRLQYEAQLTQVAYAVNGTLANWWKASD